MKAVYLDGNVANAIIHKEEHMRLGNMPESIRSMKFISDTGRKMSIQQFFDYYKDSIHAVAEYIRTAQAGENDASDDAETDYLKQNSMIVDAFFRIRSDIERYGEMKDAGEREAFLDKIMGTVIRTVVAAGAAE